MEMEIDTYKAFSQEEMEIGEKKAATVLNRLKIHYPYYATHVANLDDKDVESLLRDYAVALKDIKIDALSYGLTELIKNHKGSVPTMSVVLEYCNAVSHQKKQEAVTFTLEDHKKSREEFLRLKAAWMKRLKVAS